MLYSYTLLGAMRFKTWPELQQSSAAKFGASYFWNAAGRVVRPGESLTVKRLIMLLAREW
jgi:hypothetical protein